MKVICRHQCYLSTFNELYNVFFFCIWALHKLGLCMDLGRNPLAHYSNCNPVPPLQVLPGYKRCPDQTLNLHLRVFTDQPHRLTIALGFHTATCILVSSRHRSLHSLLTFLPSQLIPPSPNLIHPREIHFSS